MSFKANYISDFKKLIAPPSTVGVPKTLKYGMKNEECDRAK